MNFVIFLMVVAAAEVGLALAIIITLNRTERHQRHRHHQEAEGLDRWPPGLRLDPAAAAAGGVRRRARDRSHGCRRMLAPGLGIAAMGVVFARLDGILLWLTAQGAHYAADGAVDHASGPSSIEVGVQIDPLTAMMLVVVSFVSLLVQVYSMGYMEDEERFRWYYGAISLFTAAMLGVVHRRRLAAHVHVLGGHGPRLVPAHRLLVRGRDRGRARRQQGVHGDPHRRRRLRPRARHHVDLDAARFQFEPRLQARRDRRMGGPDARRRRAAAVHGRDGQERAVPAARLAARRDGRPDARFGAHPRRDDGRRRRLPGGAVVPALRGQPGDAHGRRDDRHDHGGDGRAHRASR